MRSPRKVLVISAHPDDAEFTSAGTIARWVREGAEVVYLVCTDGDKGTSDPAMTPERLAQIRQQEQREAARILGVKEVVFLHYPDGGLEDTPDLRGRIVREIRRTRPEVVLAPDPFRRTFPIHRDHRITGIVALDACYPYARDPLHYPEHLREGLQPHKVETILLWGTDEPGEFVDITETFPLKMEALRQHRSQVNPHEVEGRLRDWARRMGEMAGVPLAEGFRRIDFRF